MQKSAINILTWVVFVYYALAMCFLFTWKEVIAHSPILRYVLTSVPAVITLGLLVWLVKELSKKALDREPGVLFSVGGLAFVSFLNVITLYLFL